MKFEGTQVNIPIKGIMRAGTDNLAAEGAMNEVIGMEYKDGSWLPYEVKSSDDTTNLSLSDIIKTYAHKLSDGTQKTLYLKQDRTLYYPNASNNLVEIVTLVRDVAFVGNMLCVATDRGLEYYIYEEGVYYRYQTGYYPHVDLRVTEGLYEKDASTPPEGASVIGMRHVSYIMGEKIGLSDADVTILGEKTRAAKISGGITAVRGEVRDRGGLTGHIVACVAYRGKNGQIIAAGAPILLARPYISLEGNHKNLGKQDGKFYTYRWDRTAQEYRAVECTEEELRREPIYQEPLYSEIDWDRENSDMSEEGVTRLYKKEYDTGNDTPGEGWTGADNEGKQIGLEEVSTNAGRPPVLSDYTVNVHNENRRLYLMAISADYDVSKDNHSLPLPLFCTEEETYMYAGDGTSISTDVKRDYTFYSYATANKLQYRIPDLTREKRRELYSICIFISQEIDPFIYKDKVDDTMDMVDKSRQELICWTESGTPSVVNYKEIKTWATTYRARYRSADDILEKIKNVRSLYLVKELIIDDITPSDEWVSVDLSGVLGDSLVTRESLPLSAFNRNVYLPSKLDTYNLRLHMFDYTTELFKGYGILDFAHHGGEYQYPTGEMDDSHCTYKWEIKVEINDGNGETRVVNYDAEGSESIINYLSPMIVYPNKFADSITIRIYAYDDRDTPSTPREDLLSRSYEAKFNLQHNESLGISYYIDPDLKPIIPSMMETPF